ncbi:adenylate cyclase-like [Anopheles merus]|uniref:adenylate cyclase-like n=1 Tax=Anopheles merus TaxID=30066 RepID=UPI001BE45C3A|nr:adenylate cyclase-like [Anopheles merus]
MRFKHLDTLTFDHSIAKHLVETVEQLEIVDSRALIHFILPSANAIQRLTIARTQLNWIHFQPNEAVLLVSIVSSNLHLVPPSLRNLNNVKYIKLQKSYIRYLNLDLLQWLRKLDTLDLMYNKIHTLASTLQCLQQHNLVTLNLRNNQLRILNLELLPLIGLFEQVDLSHNKIELLVGRFSSDHLQTLIVSHNRLKVIDFCQWDAMPTLAKISFEANELTRVPNCIHHLPNLSYVGFGRNKFTQVDMERFVGFQWYCSKYDGVECTIHYLGELKSDLSKLKNITNGATFIRFTRVKALTVDQATIVHLPDTVRKLEITDSQPVQIIIIPSYLAITCLFVHITQLRWIHFQPNDAVRELSIRISNLQQIPPTVQNLTNLQHISLQHSHLQHLNLDLLHWCRFLHTVDLSYNEIHTITSTPHAGQQRQLSALLLNHNQLSVLNLEVLAPIGWFAYVDFSYNRIELLVGRFSSEHMATISFAYNRLKTVDFCQWEQVTNLTFISFLSNDLTSVPNCINRLTNLTTVSLISNQLTIVTMDAFAGMDNLTSLYLSHNNIRSITVHEGRYPKQLQQLFLSGNRHKCDNHLFGQPFCSVDIDFKPSSRTSDWSRNENALKRQLSIIV